MEELIEGLIINKGKYRVIENGGYYSVTLHLQIKKWYGWIDIYKIELERQNDNFEIEYPYYLREFNGIIEKLENI